MSIFKRRDHTEVEQANAATPEARVQEAATEQQAPGVVPPPASPIYSTRQPAPALRDETEQQVQAAVPAAVPVAVRERVAARAPAAQGVNRVRQRLAAQNVGSYVPPAPRPRATAPRMAFVQPRHTFDPIGATQAGLLNLAWKWQEAGAPIRAIHAYYDVLIRYPGTPGADAAVADLVDLSDKLAHTGQFHIALAIYDNLEDLL